MQTGTGFSPVRASAGTRRLCRSTFVVVIVPSGAACGKSTAEAQSSSRNRFFFIPTVMVTRRKNIKVLKEGSANRDLIPKNINILKRDQQNRDLILKNIKILKQVSAKSRSESEILLEGPAKNRDLRPKNMKF